MAKKKTKIYDEAELIEMFGLERLAGNEAHPLMKEWVNCSTTLHAGEKYLFEEITKDLLSQING